MVTNAGMNPTPNRRAALIPPLEAGLKTNAQMEELLGRIDSVCKGLTPSASSMHPAPRFTAQRPVLGVRCPQCNKRALRKAKRDSAVTRLAAMILFQPYRCRYCRYSEFRFMFDGSAKTRKT
jgi:hypothetical protein